ncbi:MAG: hypothetical protein K0Q96_1953, partial [Rubrobacteraceae bacterium]|nr:hypothetical protein [Rubrobacteraceae bacterium]
MPGPVLLFRTNVENDHVPLAHSLHQLHGVHGLQRIPVHQVGLDHPVELGQTRLRQSADGLPRPEHVFVSQPVVHVEPLAARLDHPRRFERLEVLR